MRAGRAASKKRQIQLLCATYFFLSKETESIGETVSPVSTLPFSLYRCSSDLKLQLGTIILTPSPCNTVPDVYLCARVAYILTL